MRFLRVLQQHILAFLPLDPRLFTSATFRNMFSGSLDIVVCYRQLLCSVCRLPISCLGISQNQKTFLLLKRLIVWGWRSIWCLDLMVNCDCSRSFQRLKISPSTVSERHCHLRVEQLHGKPLILQVYSHYVSRCRTCIHNIIHYNIMIYSLKYSERSPMSTTRHGASMHPASVTAVHLPVPCDCISVTYIYLFYFVIEIIPMNYTKNDMLQ